MFPGLIFDMFLYLASLFGRTGAVIVLGIGGIVVVFLCYRVACMFTESVVGSVHIPDKPKAQTEKLELIDEAEFARRIEKSPNDTPLIRENCRRLKIAKDHGGYARELERYLSLNPKIEIEERCMLHHQLADLYLGPLDRPEHAERVLIDFLRAFPNSKQATLMKERVLRIKAQSMSEV